MQRARWLVTGATGAVGPRIVRVLHDAGHAVRTLSRGAPSDGLLPAGVEIRLGDITDSSAVKAAMEGVQWVVHLAALLHVTNPSPALHKEYERINIDGTFTVVDAAARAGVERVVLFSTIGVYGRGIGQVVTETTPPRPDTYYAETKLAAERVALEAKRPDGQCLGAVLRSSAVYGSRIKGHYRRLLLALARRRFIPIGNGHNRRALIHEEDVAGAALLAACHPAAAGGVFNVSDGQAHTVNEIITTMCESLGRTPPRMSLPVGPVRLAAGLLEDTVRLTGRQSPIRRTMIDKYTEDVTVDSRRIQTELGFVARHDLAAGLRETVQAMRRGGDL